MIFRYLKSESRNIGKNKQTENNNPGNLQESCSQANEREKGHVQAIGHSLDYNGKIIKLQQGWIKRKTKYSISYNGQRPPHIPTYLEYVSSRLVGPTENPRSVSRVSSNCVKWLTCVITKT